MRIWTVHADRRAEANAPAEGSPAAAPAPRPPVLVPERFAWGAFFLGALWLLWHRLWLATLGYLLLAFALALVVPPAAAWPAAFGLQWLLGAQANDLRRWTLARRGFRLAGVVAARDEDAALARLVEQQPALGAPLLRASLA
jgi:hypothetical protein